MLAGIVAMRALTEIVPAGEYGRLSLITGIISFASLVVYSPFGKASNRNIWDYVNRGQGSELIGGLMVIFALSGLLITCLLLVARFISPDLVFPIEGAFWAIPVFLIAGSFGRILLGILNTLGKRRIFVLGSVTQAWLKPCLAILLVLTVTSTAESVLTGYAISSVLVLMGTLVVTYRYNLLSPSLGIHRLKSLLELIFPYVAPFMVINLLYWTQVTANRYVLNIALGVEQVGIFVVAAAVARTPVQLMESTFGQIHQPQLFKKIGIKHDIMPSASIIRQGISEYAQAFLVIVPPVALFTAIGGGLLIRLLAGAGYWIGAIVIPWVVTADFLRAASAVLAIAFEVERRPHSLVLPMVVVAVLTLSLTVLFTRTMGIVGAGLALAVGSATGFLLYQWKASQLNYWSFPLPAVLRAGFMSILIVGAAWLASQLLSESSLQAIVYVVVFGIGYLVYAGRKIFG